jgi:rhodanese-related sulfurtransferase
MTETDPEEIKQWLDQDLAILIDVREHQELAEFSIPGALHNPMSNFNVDAIPKNTDKKLIFFCAHGMRSRQVGEFLLQEKYVSVAYNMTGGVAAWVEAGFSDQS